MTGFKTPVQAILNKKPAFRLREAGFKTGGMDETRTRDLLRDRQTL
jgi:hypothetical protein